MARRVLILALVSLTACVSGTDFTNPPPVPDSGPITWTDGGQDSGVPDSGVPDAGQQHYDAGTRDAGTVVVGEWNIEFFAFGGSQYGPADDEQQALNVTQVMGQANADIWSVEEVSNDARFAQVVSDLRSQWGEDFDYVLADDPNIGNPYTGYGSTWGQKPGVLWRKSLATRVGAQLVDQPTNLGSSTKIDANWRTNFANRDPLEVHLQMSTPSGLKDLWVIAVHLKANSGGSDTTADWTERYNASLDLKSYLDQYHPNDAVIVLGDWNDDLDQSITSGESTPFQNFLDDPTHYLFPSQAFDSPQQGTTIHYSSAIDHHLINSQLFGNYVTDSAFIEHPVVSLPTGTNYGSNNTSDHYPTFATYQFP